MNEGDKRLDNLNPWQPGQSGNPKGRPKGTGIRPWMKIIAEEEDFDHPIKDAEGNIVSWKTKGEVVAEKVLELAKGGGSKALEVLIDGVDGKLLQRLQVEPLDINVKYTDGDTES